MADTRTADIRALLGGGAGGDRVAATHLLVGAVFLVAGGALAVLALLSLRFPDQMPIVFSQLEPMMNLGLLVGFGVVSLVGGVYYVLPRLTGAALWGPGLARLGLAGMVAVVVAGLVVVPLGLGSGRQPFDLPWWLSAALALVSLVPLMVTVGTISQRTEQRSYVSIWFALGGVCWLALLSFAYLVGDLPSATALAVAYTDVFYQAGLVTMVIATLGSGLYYYTLVKELDVSLASRQLALVGFWSLGFASVWWGVAQLTFGPGPTWVSGVAAALGLAFPVGALANAANASLTLEGAWGELDKVPGARAGLYGLYGTLGLALLAAMAGFRSVAAVTSLTAFWEAIENAFMTGVGPLLVAGISFQALPRLLGREIHSMERAASFIKLTIVGATGTLVSMSVSGMVTGYSWIAGSNSAAYIDAGEGWGQGAGAAPDALMLVAVLFAFVTLSGHLAYASTVLGTLVRGRAASQEVLVSMEADDE